MSSAAGRAPGGRFLSSSDSYDPARVGLDQDLLRRFYQRSGYPDFQLLNTEAELAPDRSSFYLTFVLDEGPRYRVGHVSIVSHLPHLDGATLTPDLQLARGRLLQWRRHHGGRFRR